MVAFSWKGNTVMNQLKITFTCASLLGVLLAGQTNSARAADITVCPSGCNHTTVQAGINAAVSGDTVLVGTTGRTTQETYVENFQMKDGVSVVSEGDDSLTTYTDPYGKTTQNTKQVLKRATLTILQGLGNSTVVSFSAGTDAVLDGFTIENIDDTAPDDTALIYVDDSSPTIQNNIVRDNQGLGESGGITVVGGAAVAMPQIQNNVIHYVNGHGIGVFSKAVPTIVDNEIFTTPPVIDTTPGIGFHNDSAATILNNHIFSNGSAGIGSKDIGVYDSGYEFVIQGNIIHDNLSSAGISIIGQVGQSTANVNVTIGGSAPAEGNIVYANNSGVRLGFELFGTPQLLGTALVQNNTFRNNRSPGLWVSKMTFAEVRDNTMESNVKPGMRADGNKDIIIEYNTMQNNLRAGLRLMTSLEPDHTVLVQNNHMINNTYGGIVVQANTLNAVIKKNEITGNGYSGIRIMGGTALEFGDNHIAYNSRGGIHTGNDQADGVGLFNGETNDGFTLTIRGNKVHHNGQNTYGGGIDVRHGNGTIENNLVYKNNTGGIRFGDWIDAINNNTVVDNGLTSETGGGIIYGDLLGEVNEPPTGFPPAAIPIRNNILVGNYSAGINAGTKSGGTCSDWLDFRDYNLLYGNNAAMGACPTCERLQLGSCIANEHEIFAAPLFVDESSDDYHLQAGSPAVDAGDPAFPDDAQPPGLGTPTSDMGAYGSEYGINW